MFHNLKKEIFIDKCCTVIIEDKNKNKWEGKYFTYNCVTGIERPVDSGFYFDSKEHFDEYYEKISKSYPEFDKLNNFNKENER